MVNVNEIDCSKGNEWDGLCCEGNEWDGIWSEGSEWGGLCGEGNEWDGMIDLFFDDLFLRYGWPTKGV